MKESEDQSWSFVQNAIVVSGDGRVYTKQEVIEIVFEAFNSAKTIGEGQIKKLK